MKKKFNLFIQKDENLKDTKAKYNFQIEEEYWNKRKIECEKSLSKFC